VFLENGVGLVIGKTKWGRGDKYVLIQPSKKYHSPKSLKRLEKARWILILNYRMGKIYHGVK
jgi:hypothetical protein